MSAKASEQPQLWVVAIIIALAFVMIANGVFIYVAVSGADPVVPSYNLEHR